MGSGSHRATRRREKLTRHHAPQRAQRAREEGQPGCASDVEKHHPIGPGVVRSIYYHIYALRVLWPGRRRARPAGRARGYSSTLNPGRLGGDREGKGVNRTSQAVDSCTKIE
eukprot:4144195-Prymnesium_polylepis.1